jgi:hypothetical protein
MRKPYLNLIALILLPLAMAPHTRAQDRPFLSPDADTVPTGTLRVQAGLDFLEHVSYPLSGLEGDQTNVGVVDLRLGLARIVEVELNGIVQEYLQVNQQGPSFVDLQLRSPGSTYDVGDFSLYTKIHIADQARILPAFAFRFGFTMPNSDQSRGLGNNATNVMAETIAQRQFGTLETFGSLGLGILTAPNTLFTQNDVLLYGVGASYPVTKRINLVAEASGQHSTRAITPQLVGTESRGQGRLGVQVLTGGFTLDAAFIAGLNRNDPHTGVTFGVSHDFRLSNRTPKTP